MAIRLVLFFTITLSSLSLHSQIIDNDYSKIGEIQSDPHVRDKLPFQFFVNVDRDIVLIGYGIKPTKFVAYRLSDWSVVSSFDTKGYVSEAKSYFDEENNDIFYVKKSRGKSVFRVDFRTGYVEKMKCKETPKGCDFYNSKDKDYVSLWDQNYSDFYFFYKSYLIFNNRKSISLYKRINP
ncbi:hypothetical protein OB69_10800 [Roseivirga seohaensis subsp. aquiponti]|uniref:Uncharacterized protein n=1 Tax=Roseivirga seohaensis subsp. aquiponti TaxID=1566026 RepID=A0A0L8AKM0_9BACT|nr:hypothetical protein [Roseivirga seohaensis]KOF02781.1 hypothetical protein OB69_10800 [Roseivirga seohaensis subsp. aquiponti]